MEQAVIVYVTGRDEQHWTVSKSNRSTARDLQVETKTSTKKYRFYPSMQPKHIHEHM